MSDKSPRDEVSRALNSIDRAWRAVRNARRVGEMTAAAEKAASAAAAVAQKPLEVRADARIYRDTGKIVALVDHDLEFDDDDLEFDDDYEVALIVDADTFAQAMDETAERLESQAHSWNERAYKLESTAHMRDEWIGRRQQEYGFLSETAQDRGYDYEMLVAVRRTSAKVSKEITDTRWRAKQAQSDAAQKRRSAADARAAPVADAQARRRWVALREVESEARRKADSAIAKARRRVMAATLADDDDSLSEDRTTELLGRLADLVGSDAVRRLRADRDK